MRGRDAGRADLFQPAEFPRSAKYDSDWVLENMMGPNALWLTEPLYGCMSLSPGKRVLDIGCGKGFSSIFLAKEYGVQVWETDLWIDASDHLGRIRAAGVEDRVFPIHAEAHALPFADGFFDAMISVDAYHYFGTDDLYLENHMARLVKPGGQIGIIVPGLVEELTSGDTGSRHSSACTVRLGGSVTGNEAGWWTSSLPTCSRTDGGTGWPPTCCGRNDWASPVTKPIY